MSDRQYPLRDVKILYAKSAGMCAFPGCTNECIADATVLDREALLSEIAHLVSHANSGPRCDPLLPADRRDCYENWILLCRYHHGLIDKQPNTYTTDDLRKWKSDHETWVRATLQQNMPRVSFVELVTVCQAVLANPQPFNPDLTLTDPAAKMSKNNLSDESHFLLTMGLSKAREVGQFVRDMERLDSRFSERLKAGFVFEYDRLVADGLWGDSLFEGLRRFASMGSRDFRQQAAGLAVLTYLFEKCEVFVK